MGHLAVHPSHDDGELLATYAPHQIILARLGHQHPGHVPDHLITAAVTKSVIDALEVVDVEHHHAAHLPWPRPLPLPEQAAPVEHPGEGIPLREGQQRLLRLHIGHQGQQQYRAYGQHHVHEEDAIEQPVSVAHATIRPQQEQQPLAQQYGEMQQINGSDGMEHPLLVPAEGDNQAGAPEVDHRLHQGQHNAHLEAARQPQIGKQQQGNPSPQGAGAPGQTIEGIKAGQQQQYAHEGDQATDPDPQGRMTTPYPQTEQQDGEGEEEGRQGPEQEVAPTRLQKVDEQHEQCRHQIDCQGDQQQGRGVDHLDASLV